MWNRLKQARPAHIVMASLLVILSLAVSIITLWASHYFVADFVEHNALMRPLVQNGWLPIWKMGISAFGVGFALMWSRYSQTVSTVVTTGLAVSLAIVIEDLVNDVFAIFYPLS